MIAIVRHGPSHHQHFETSLRAVPKEYREGALALGASGWKPFSVVVPAANRIAASVLGMGRAVGETMAVIMVCGNIPRIPAR